MHTAILVFPNQLFTGLGIKQSDPLILIEDPIFFADFDHPIAFNKLKLVLHRASMKAFAESQSQRGRHVRYIEYAAIGTRERYELFFKNLMREGVRVIRHYWTGDVRLEERLERIARKEGLGREVFDSPSFLCTAREINTFFHDLRHYNQTSFYIVQRKRLGIALEQDDAPLGGKWTFDIDNRERIPKNLPIPVPRMFGNNTHVREACAYVQRHFSDHHGSVDGFVYPITATEASALLDDFLKNRLSNFGRYQDGMRQGEAFAFHSLLSSSLNTGLITPSEVVSRTITFVESNRVPLASFEGFIRQIIGWREFVRGVYVVQGNRQRTSNIWGHRRSLPDSFYTATTGIDPVDDCIRRVQAHAYNHHIERLMVLGNIMLLCEIDPDEVYRWFMEMYIDAYDWVMVPNVYGMSQFADGGLMASKPYISSSHYIRSMSDFSSGPWCIIWDGLFWRFVEKHRTFFLNNPRLSMMARQLDRMDPANFIARKKAAADFLQRLWR